MNDAKYIRKYKNRIRETNSIENFLQLSLRIVGVNIIVYDYLIINT